MRHFVLAYLILLATVANATQYKSIFGSESTAWNLAMEIGDGIWTDQLILTGDTVINTTTYKIVESKHSPRNKYFIRESTDHSMVFCITPILSNQELVVFDLNLQKQDTFRIGIGQEETIVVDTVFVQNNTKHIRFDLLIADIGGTEKEYFEFIEGIGSNCGLFYQGIERYNIFQNHYLLCAYKNDTVAYANKSDYFLGICYINWDKLIKNNFDLKVEIYPNPVETNLKVALKTNNTKPVKIYIYNYLGKLTETIITDQNEISLNLSNIPSGSYFLAIKYGKEIIVKKFNKQ